MKTEQAHKAGQHETNPNRRCKLCWEVARAAQSKIEAVSDLDLITLKMSIEEHVRTSYLPSLKRCVDAGFVIFANLGRGAPMLTDAGRAALARIG